MPQSLASFGKNIKEVRSKYASVHAYYRMLTSSSCMCGIWSFNKTPFNAGPILHFLGCLNEVDKGIFGLSLNPRHAVIMANSQRSFREVMAVFVVKKTSKAHILMVYVPQCIAYTNFSFEFTSKQMVEAQQSFYDALHHRYRTSSVASSTNNSTSNPTNVKVIKKTLQIQTPPSPCR